MLSGCVPGASSLSSQVRARHKTGTSTGSCHRRGAAPVCAVARGVEQATQLLQLQQQEHHTAAVRTAEGTPTSCAAATAPVQHQQQQQRQQQHLQQQHLQQLHAVEMQHQQQFVQHIQHAVLPAAAWEPAGLSHAQPDQLVIVQEQQEQQQQQQQQVDHQQQQQQEVDQQQVTESGPTGVTLERIDLQHRNGHCNGTRAAATVAGHTVQLQQLPDQHLQQQQHVHQIDKQQDCSCDAMGQQRQRQKLPKQQQAVTQQQQQQQLLQASNQQVQKQQQQVSNKQQPQAKRPQASSSSSSRGRSCSGLREFRVANSTQPDNLATSLGVYLKQHQVKHSKRQQKQQQQHQRQALRQPAAAAAAAPAAGSSSVGALDSCASVPDVLLCCTSKAALHTALQALAVASRSAAQLQQPYHLLLQPQLLQQPVAQPGSSSSRSSSNSGGGRVVMQYQLQLSWLPLQQQQQQAPALQQQSGAQQPVVQQQQQQLPASCQLLQCDHLASLVPSSSSSSSSRSTSTKAPKHRKHKHKASAAAAADDSTAGSNQQHSSSMFQPAAANLYQLEWQLYGALKGAWPTGLCFSNAVGALAAFKALVGVRSRLAAAGCDLFASVQRADSSSGSSSGGTSAVVLWVTSVPAVAAVQRQPAAAAAAAAAVVAVSAAAVSSDRLPGLPAVEQQVKEHRQMKQKLRQQQQQQQQGVGAQPTQQPAQRRLISRQRQQQKGVPGSEAHASGSQQQPQRYMEDMHGSHAELQHSSMHSPSLLPELQDVAAAAAAGDSHPVSPPLQPASSSNSAACQRPTNGKACHADLAVPVAAVPVPPEQLQPLC